MELGSIKPLCDLLTLMDSKIVQVALNGLENILRLGELEAKRGGGINPYCALIEEAYGKQTAVPYFIDFKNISSSHRRFQWCFWRTHSLPFAFFSGLDKLEFLQGHENQEIYQKAFDLIERYFSPEDEDPTLAPAVDLQQQQFLFQQCEAPMEGFQL